MNRRWPLLALLAAIHLGLLGLLGSQMKPARQAKARPLWASLSLWLRPPIPAKPLDQAIERPRREPKAAAPATVAQDLPPSGEVATTPTSTDDQVPASSGATAATEAPGGTRAPLRIELPKAGKAGQFTPFNNPALSDPRSNTRLRLTVEEKMAIALGSMECVLEERQPDGTIWRGGGRLITVTGTGAGGVMGAVVTLCVR